MKTLIALLLAPGALGFGHFPSGFVEIPSMDMYEGHGCFDEGVTGEAGTGITNAEMCWSACVERYMYSDGLAAAMWSEGDGECTGDHEWSGEAECVAMGCKYDE